MRGLHLRHDFLLRNIFMTTYASTDAMHRLDTLIRNVARDHQPVVITTEHGNAVMVSQDDWQSIEETLFLLSVPGMRESIRHGIDTPVSDCDTNPGW
jgi:antitoxin YefM